jgi:hypothetical protein
MSKTPQFDALLDPILESLVPHTKTCMWKGKHAHCQSEFEITKDDIEFLRMLRVPPPNYCPTCRRIRRLTHMGINRLFKRKCQAPEHNEMIISSFSEKCPFPVYDYQYFIGDNFDPFSFGCEYKEGSPMDFLYKMRKTFPIPSFLNRDPSCINSEYSSGGRNLKNGYYVSGCYDCEDIWYSGMAGKSRNIMDSRVTNSSEFVYGSFFADHLYKCIYTYFSTDCSNSIFLYDCKNCTDCLGCVNLRNKKYNIFNKQFSKEEYESFIKSITPFSRKKISELEKIFWDLIKQQPINASRNVGSSNVNGVNIRFSNDIFDCVEINNSQNIRHSDSVLSHNDSMDILFSGGNSHHLYGDINIGSQSSGVRFSISSKFCTDCEFIFNCKNLNDCFMCFGLQNKSYCVLNKQYTKEEYYKIVDSIKVEMLNREEYNDGPGLEFSAQAYNFSLSMVSYPLSDEEIKNIGGYVANDPDTNAGSIDIIKYIDVPQTINEVSDDILTKAIQCSVTGRPFRVIKSEVDFYRQMNLPLPIVHPSIRMENQYKVASPGKKYKATCAKCLKDIESIFDTKDNYILYCEKCYQKEVV